MCTKYTGLMLVINIIKMHTSSVLAKIQRPSSSQSTAESTEIGSIHDDPNSENRYKWQQKKETSTLFREQQKWTATAIPVFQSTSSTVTKMWEEAPNLVAFLVSIAAILLAYLCVPKRHATPKSPQGIPSPPFVPYCIPFLGSAYRIYRKGIHPFLQEITNSHNAPIVTALVAGQRLHFVTDPSAFDAVTELGMGPVSGDIAQTYFGISWKGMDIIRKKQEDMQPWLDQHLLLPNNKSADGGLEQQITRTVQESLQQNLRELIPRDDSVSMDTHPGLSFRYTGDEEVYLKMDLMEFIHKVMFCSVLDAVVSPDVSHEAFLSEYSVFEQGMTATACLGNLLRPVQYPSGKSTKAREQLIRWLMKENIDLSEYLQARRDFLKEQGVSLEDQARDNLLWTWRSVSNLLPTLFWLLYHVAKTPKAVKAIRAECDDKVKAKSFLTLEDLTELPALGSAFQEILRLTLHLTIRRQVMKDMEIDLSSGGDNSKFFLQEGDQLIMYTPILHHNSQTYPKPLKFQWDRFLNNNNEDYASMRPFGGGPHCCPGRKFAENAAKAFVAHVICKYDVEMDGEAEPDLARDGLGILHSDERVQVILRDRD